MRRHGPGGDPEQVGGLFRAHVEQDPERDDLSLPIRKLEDPANELRIGRRVVVDRRLRHGDGQQSHVLAPVTPGMVEGGLHDPRDRRGMRLEVGPIAEGAGEGLRDGVFRQPPIARRDEDGAKDGSLFEEKNSSNPSRSPRRVTIYTSHARGGRATYLIPMTTQSTRTIIVGCPLRGLRTAAAIDPFTPHAPDLR